MTTSFDEIYDRFFRKVEEDSDFFEYYNCTPEEAVELAKERASGYLQEAVSTLEIRLSGFADVDFYDKNDTEFNFELVGKEIEILSRMMFIIYLERDIAKLKTVINSMTSSDIKMLYSPANERNSFDAMLKNYKNDTDIMITQYLAVDRTTGKHKKIEYEEI